MSAEPDLLLSIVTPTYQRLAALQHSLEARLELVARLWPTAELIVSDNASTDGAWDYIQSVCAGRAGVTIRRETQTVSPEQHYLNAARHARGRYLQWVADDDDIYCDHYAALIDLLATADRPFYYLPFEGIGETDAANPSVLQSDGLLAVQQLPWDSPETARILIATSFRATNLWRLEALHPYFERWLEWDSTCYSGWRAVLLTLAQEPALSALNKLFGCGNRWDEVEQRVPVFEVGVMGRLLVWAQLPSATMRRRLVPAMSALVSSGLWACPSWRERFSALLRMSRLSPGLVARAIPAAMARKTLRRLGWTGR